MNKQKPNLTARLTLLAFVVTIVAASMAFPTPARASFSYRIPKQQDQLTINKDGSVQLVRYFEFLVEPSSTDAGTEIWAGLPTSSTTVSSVVDEDGKHADFSVRSSGGDYVVAIKGFPAIKPGKSRSFTVTAAIPDFLYPDTRNEGYVTMQYSPGWWSSSVKVQDVAVIFPGAVEKSEIKTGSRRWDGIAQTESGAYVVSWQFSDLKPDEKVTINVGFPQKHVTLPAKEEPGSVPGPVKPAPVRPSIPGISDHNSFTAMIGIVALLFVGAAVVAAVRASNREEYSSPEVRMEGVGINETLSPVEVSVLLRQPPEKTLTLLLFGLIKKGAVRVTSAEPLKVSVDSERGLDETERLFIAALDRAAGDLDPEKLIPCFKYLSTSLNEKMRPYCRRDTESFYRGEVRRLWDEVADAGTPELKLEAMDRNMLWLLQDEDRLKEAEAAFPRDRTADALPNWWLYGFMFNRPFGYMYYMWPGSIYGQYHGIYDRILGDRQERFREVAEEVFRPAAAPARSIFRSPGSDGHSHGGGFTPPSCACACACVSCACACACAGGGGCT